MFIEQIAMEEIEDKNKGWKNREMWQCKVTPDTFTAATLKLKIAAGEAKQPEGIILNPDYQRKFRFSVKKQSSIIESILLEIPIPLIYLSVDISTDIVLFNVIDGMHRLNSIYNFLNDGYKLTGMKVLTDLEGLSFTELPREVRNFLLYQSKIRVETINVTHNKDLEYEVFLRFNEESNPLKKQELNDVVYISNYSTMFKNELMPKIIENKIFQKTFAYTKPKEERKELNYNVYVLLGYSKYKFTLNKNDSPYYVAQFMDDMAKLKLDDEGAKKELKKTEEYLLKFLEFYGKISEVSGVEYIFSKEFINKIKPTGAHKFLTSLSIQLVLLYDYILDNGYMEYLKNDIDYKDLYNVMSTTLKKAGFDNFEGKSSTSLKFQKGAYDKTTLKIAEFFELLKNK
ncbi:DUF262 domain-containing protein [Paraclostridium sordellii]|uniref:DUF262 domain-containing protein n=1 Tax=Paraclostridium sordellii TaxID=1505 RepID=UPI000C785E6F|nr:DUF262 domain-containing protein [Paeniclostridium sordellii]AUN13841.1 hypothetical protein RSJ16_06215 [Paeniclostridium sordellii]